MRTAKTVAIGRVYGAGKPCLGNADPRGVGSLTTSYLAPATKVYGSLLNLHFQHPGTPATFNHVNAFGVDIYVAYLPVNATLNG